MSTAWAKKMRGILGGKAQQHSLTAELDVQPWMDDALCTQVGDPDLWFYKGDSKQARTAMSVCANCPVREACLTYALDRPELVGVWGGTTTRQRTELRKAAS